ncbi:DUF6794 domain-containing protein [Methylomonas sp. MS20]|uniref:DUF6794 domain-containing protein n=1 Tax=unclassified Methylomonas TaxID=2608980 RepID=UPI0028A4E5A6|nr:DUF6794 domain-containing protein [Methylomonas sp. MV1]MDT4330765.1 DUF6794 domain-containing protein [Methylomonas sp. MV1]
MAEAVARLLLVLEEKDQLTIAAMELNNLIDLHYGLGLAIRNAYDLHNPDNPLLIECDTSHPDDAALFIIHALWQRLQ